MPTAADVEKAAEIISGVVERTPLYYSPRLSEMTGAKIYLKREDLQGVRSYKIRGAYNVIAQLNDEQRRAGVVAASAGNHAQGVAYGVAPWKYRDVFMFPLILLNKSVIALCITVEMQ